MQQWTVVAGVCATPGAEGYPTYGVAVTLPDGTHWVWADADVDLAVVTQLVDRLQAVQPERCHFEEIILDFIEETAAKM